MTEFHRVNDDAVVGGPARILVAPISYPLSKRLSEIVSLSTYDPTTSTYGWEDVGGTQEGVTFGLEVSTQEWRNDQYGLFRTVPIDWRGSVTAIAMETTQRNREILLGAAGDTANGAGEAMTYYEAAGHIPHNRVAILYLDDTGLLHATLYPDVQWDGKKIDQMFKRGQPYVINFNFTAFPSSDALGPDNLASLRLDIDQ